MDDAFPSNLSPSWCPPITQACVLHRVGMRGPQDCVSGALAPGFRCSPQPKRPLLHGLLTTYICWAAPTHIKKGREEAQDLGEGEGRTSPEGEQQPEPQSPPSLARTSWLLSEALVGLPSPYQPWDRGCGTSQTKPFLWPQNRGLGMCFLPRHGGQHTQV